MSEQALTGWIDRSPVAALIVDARSQVVAANVTVVELLESSAEDIMKQPFVQLLSRSGRMFYLGHILPSLQQHAAVDEIYLRLRTKAGQEIPVLLNATYHNTGGVDYYYFAMMPMQRRNILEDQLVEAKQEAEHALAAEREALAELERAKLELEKQQSELKRLNTRLEHLATTDPLTKLANRRAFEARLENNLSLVRRDSMGFSLLSLDLDHFKDINDRYGHDTGDKVLVAIGSLLASMFRTADLAARTGGEEFAVILSDADLSVALGIAERLRGSIEALEFDDFRVTASIGVTTAQSEDTREDLLRRADQALYKAKRASRNCVKYLTG
ncbi:GGDEF domain-containing protein [Pseudidiomarina halophila]|uniref:diguanylate cyclase n=1 Tax=Pseudidiomarina halophila TaxID=1449799 RepID=A0A432XW39_9GAMM|nr:sensor domain-containing diguanylate cyclase [Pseudidiomarina halophila]RUO52917.1 hypothetical protein CWI69_07735 [Pseudidiomarina halophila]